MTAFLNKKLTDNPFRPGSGLPPPFFADREREIQTFQQRLAMTAQGIPMHLAVVGEWAIGKTALLSVYREIADEQNCTTLFIMARNMPAAKFVDSLIQALSSNVKERYEDEKLWDRFVKKVQAVSVGLLNVIQVGAEFRSPEEFSYSLREYLKILWQELRDYSVPAIVLIIDDLDLLTDFRDTMILLRNTSQELQELQQRVHLMLVIAGTPNLFDRLREAHEPLLRFFKPLELQPLPEDAARAAVTVPLEGTEVRFNEEVIARILELAGGQPYYLQLLAFHTFEAARFQGRRKGRSIIATGATLQTAFDNAFSDLERQMFVYRIKRLSHGEQKLLWVIANFGGPVTHGEIAKAAEKAGLKRTSVATLLRRLKEKGCVQQEYTGPRKGQYFIADKLFAEYVRHKLGA